MIHNSESPAQPTRPFAVRFARWLLCSFALLSLTGAFAMWSAADLPIVLRGFYTLVLAMVSIALIVVAFFRPPQSAVSLANKWLTDGDGG